MIQIFSAIPAGPDMQGMFAATAGDSASTFAALFTQTLAGQGLSADGLAKPVFPEMHGHKGPATDKALKNKADMVPELAGEVGDTAVAAGNPALLSMLGLPVPMKIDDAGATQVSAGVDEDVASLAGTGAVDADGKQAGKKLPNPLAVIAGQQKIMPAQIQQEVGQSIQVKADPLVSDVVDARLPDPKLLAVAASEKLSTTIAAIEPQTMPVSGQESAMLAARNHSGTTSPDKVVFSMQNGFGNAAWSQELGDKLVWMSGRQGQMAELILNPPSLGAVEIRLNMSGADASAQFFSANPNVRDVIEAALPKLRELMAGAGIALGEAMVSDQSFGQRGRAEQGQTGHRDSISVGGLVEDGQSVVMNRGSGTALLDYFA